MADKALVLDDGAFIVKSNARVASRNEGGQLLVKILDEQTGLSRFMCLGEYSQNQDGKWEAALLMSVEGSESPARDLLGVFDHVHPAIKKLWDARTKAFEKVK